MSKPTLEREWLWAAMLGLAVSSIGFVALLYAQYVLFAVLIIVSRLVMHTVHQRLQRKESPFFSKVVAESCAAVIFAQVVFVTLIVSPTNLSVGYRGVCFILSGWVILAIGDWLATKRNDQQSRYELLGGRLREMGRIFDDSCRTSTIIVFSCFAFLGSLLSFTLSVVQQNLLLPAVAIVIAAFSFVIWMRTHQNETSVSTPNR